MTPLSTRSFDPAAIARDFPPIVSSPNVRLVYDIADAASTTATTPIAYSRWQELPLPPHPVRPTTFHAEPNFFTYDPAESTNPTLTTWHLNFANYDVFAYYGRGLFAQDEMQVAEHPALASLRRALEPHHPATFCVHNRRPTPILIRNVERRLRIDTNPDRALGRPHGLYGNRFALASTDAIRQATTKLQPATLSNILAIEAPDSGHGTYTHTQIEYILATAYSGLRAALLESKTTNPEARVHIHTGFWGCGAYGGNRTLMTLLQLHAAQLAGIHHLTFHTGDPASLPTFHAAQQSLATLQSQTPDTQTLITTLTTQNYQWGISDGN